MRSFPPFITWEEVAARLPIIFPEGTPNRNYCIRDLSVSTIFTMLYIGAIEGSSIYLGPIHVYRMTDEQSDLSVAEDRENYGNEVLKKDYRPSGNRWYADNTREPIRDETLREGLMPLGAVKKLSGLPTTSSKPSYYLEAQFAGLFDPRLIDESLSRAIVEWQSNHLTSGALMRMRLAGLGTQTGREQLMITLPNGQTRSLSPGPSEYISKAVIEDFAFRFLERPGVLWLSTSGSHVVERELELARSIGLNIEVDRNLPDIILVDLAPQNPVLVFIEVVATDGPVTQRRQQAIFEITDAGNISRNHVTFVTAYLERESGAFSKTAKVLAWNSFAWFVSEPDKIMILRNGVFISQLISPS